MFHNSKVVFYQDSRQPSQVRSSNAKYLTVGNDKYEHLSIKHEDGGNWRMTFPRNEINRVWRKIRLAVREKILWKANVTTRNPENCDHTIMVFTKNNKDVADIAKVLKFLSKESRIQKPNQELLYFTNIPRRTYENGEPKPLYRSSEIQKKLISPISSPKETQKGPKRVYTPEQLREVKQSTSPDFFKKPPELGKLKKLFNSPKKKNSPVVPKRVKMKK